MVKFITMGKDTRYSSYLAKKNNAKFVRRAAKLTDTALSKGKHKCLVATQFERDEFGSTEALKMPARFLGDYSPETLNVISLTPAKIEVYKRNDMIDEYIGRKTGKTYLVVKFYGIYGSRGHYLINYKRMA